MDFLKGTKWIWHGEQNIHHQPPPPDDVVHEAVEVIQNSNSPSFDGVLSDDEPITPNMERSTEDHGTNTFQLPNDTHEKRRKKYERFLRLSVEPLYPNSRHKSLDALVKLNEVKMKFNLSDSAMGGMLSVFHELLPEENNLMTNFPEMKSILSEFGMECINYDVCENNCMIFWKDAIKYENCSKCGLDRYKKTSYDENGERMAIINGGSKFRTVSRKVLKHFPLIPRLRRLFSISWIAEKMTWHAQAKSCAEFLRHPRDSTDWTNADIMWPGFAKECRNVRLAFSTDGFCPNNMHGCSYSCWPVVIQPLNLPPSLCMKSEFSLLSVLIPGPTSPKGNIDVFLQPLVDELKILWSGVEVWDEHKKEFFQLCAMLMWCIHDFPAYGMLSGCTVHGHLACPICSENTPYEQLKYSKKTCYQGSRMFLPKENPFRKEKSKKAFNGKVEENEPPRKLGGDEVAELVCELEKQLNERMTNKKRKRGKGKDDEDEFDYDYDVTGIGFWKRSILWDLPYWYSLDTRHNLDPMHVEKNVAEILLGTILSITGSSNKDNYKAREDLEHMRLKKNLWLIRDEDGKPMSMPNAPFALGSESKLSFFETLKRLKVPSGFSSSFNNNVRLDHPPGPRFINMKSHDYHVLMQHLLPMLLMHSFPSNKPLFRAIQHISIFFNVLCAKVISREHLTLAKKALVEALCELEKQLPPSFFVIMIHLMHHLGDEALRAGPTRYRSIWLFERENKKFKKWSQNKRYIEGSIAQQYFLYESSLYARGYLPKKKGKYTRNKNIEATVDDEFDECGERPVGKGKEVDLSNVQFEQARMWVLSQHHDFDEWRRKFEATSEFYNGPTSKHRVDNFIPWLRNQGLSSNESIFSYAKGPQFKAISYKKFVCNGYTFSTKSHEERYNVQNSGVSMKAHNNNGVLTTYYGVIKQILDLQYPTTTHTVFYCDWIAMDDDNACKVDSFSKLVLVTFDKKIRTDVVGNEPFILASQASQVFYCPLPKKRAKLMKGNLHVVLHSPKRMTKAIDALEVDSTMYHSILVDNEELLKLL